MKTKLVFLLATIPLFLMSCNTKISPKEFRSEKEAVTVEEASKMLNQGALLIDVREKEEVAEQAYDVPSVKHIPLGEIEQRLSEIPKDIQIIMACRSGNRSGKAYLILKEKGFVNMANMEGGMNAWSAAGLPTKTASQEELQKPTDTTSLRSDESKANVAIAPSKNSGGNKLIADSKTNRLEVYCFHGTRQCETCINMKANTKMALEKYFGEQLKSGRIVFSIIDVDEPKNAMLAEKFQATGTALMINNVKNGEDNISDWSNFAFEKANEANLFIPELKTMVNSELNK